MIDLTDSSVAIGNIKKKIYGNALRVSNIMKPVSMLESNPLMASVALSYTETTSENFVNSLFFFSEITSKYLFYGEHLGVTCNYLLYSKSSTLHDSC